MATRFKIEGVQPFDGEHLLDLTYFTNRELHTIKRLSGVRAGELVEAFDAKDTDLVVALAVIALLRNGVQVPKEGEEILWDAPNGALTLILEDEEPVEDDAGPPETPKPTGVLPENGSVSSASSGVSSTNGGAHPENDPSLIGDPSSESSAFDPPISVT